MLKVTVITFEYRFPESMVAPNTPVNAQKYPVAATVTEVAGVKLGAVNLYLFAPQTMVLMGAMVMAVGALGTVYCVLMSLAAL